MHLKVLQFCTMHPNALFCITQRLKVLLFCTIHLKVLLFWIIQHLKVLLFCIIQHLKVLLFWKIHIKVLLFCIIHYLNVLLFCIIQQLKVLLLCIIHLKALLICIIHLKELLFCIIQHLKILLFYVGCLEYHPRAHTEQWVMLTFSSLHSAMECSYFHSLWHRRTYIFLNRTTYHNSNNLSVITWYLILFSIFR